MTATFLLLALSMGCNKAATEDPTDTANGRAALQPVEPDDGSSRNGGAATLTPVDLPADQESLLKALGDAEKADAAAAQLASQGSSAIPGLREVAHKGLGDAADLSPRGRAIQALAGIDDPLAGDVLRGLQDDNDQPMLVRTWAAAARVQRAADLDELIALSGLLSTYPAVRRPFTMKLEALSGEVTEVGPLLRAAASDYQLQQSLAQPILAVGPQPLLKTMFSDPDNNTRRMAASYLATMGQRDYDAVAPVVASAYAFPIGAEQILWEGGALYVPSLGWQKDEAKVLIGHMVAWHLFCQEQGLSQEQQQINNNLRSVGLTRVAGYSGSFPNDTDAMLLAWGKFAGPEALEKILAEQGLKKDEHYAAILKVARGR